MPQDPIAAVRRFSRFYTRQLGLLNETLLSSGFTLTEARVLYELAHATDPLTHAQLCHELLLDPGYLSRIIKTFETRGLVTRAADADDARQVRLRLTRAGRAAFAPLDAASQQAVGTMLKPLTDLQRDSLAAAMQTIERLLSSPSGSPITLRDFAIGDLGWIARRQALLYATEYGWNGEYEVLAAEILARYARNRDPVRERAWIAESDGRLLGSVFVMKGSDSIAKLRLLYVEPEARGSGLGKRLVESCIGFARSAGYQTLTLWTQDVLEPARRIYNAAGFRRVKSEPHHSFGRDLVGETWDLAL